MKLHDLLTQRKDLAVRFSEPFQDQTKEDLKYYNANPPNMVDALNIDLASSVNHRYNFTIPLVFTNHESMMSSMFDRVPELIFTQRGKLDKLKEAKVIAAYEYLKDKLDLESFMNDAAWWYILSGFVSSHINFVQKSIEQPVIDETTGEPVLDEAGKPQTYNDYAYDDPMIEVGDIFKEAYSPESTYAIDAHGVPFYFRWKNIEPEEIERVYHKKVDADSTIETSDGTTPKESVKGDLERVKVYFYYGTLPKLVSKEKEVKDWEADKLYMVAFTAKEVLTVEESIMPERMCRILKWHGAPNTFFGFGIGKLLRPFQREKSIRRGQMVRFADIAAFPKLLLEKREDLDVKAYRDPRENLVLTYDEKKPEYLAVPNLSAAVTDSNNLADQDAQQASGLMDISNGAQQSSTVDTATGQTIFADAAEKRVRQAKKKFMRFYRENVILLLKLCQKYWDSEKLVNITDEQGNTTKERVSPGDLSDVDFDLDVDIDTESVSVNKEVLRQQAIDLYDRTKDDPMVNRVEALKEVYRSGFDKKDPERFIHEPVVATGTTLMNPQTGEQFTTDESGNLVSAEQMQDTRASGGGQVASDPGAMMGAVA